MCNDREKLIRLLIRCGVWGANKTIGEIADFLITNGVKVKQAKSRTAFDLSYIREEGKDELNDI